MRPLLPGLALLAALALSGCGDGDGPSDAAAQDPSAAVRYSAEVRENFLTSCVDNATNSATSETDPEQLTRTCECILGKVEQEYSEAAFGDFEERLLGGEASEQENARLVGWSTSCAQETSS